MCVSLKVLSPAERTELVENIASHLSGAQQFIQKRAVHNFTAADADYGRRIQQLLDNINQHKISVRIARLCLETDSELERLAAWCSEWVSVWISVAHAHNH